MRKCETCGKVYVHRDGGGIWFKDCGCIPEKDPKCDRCGKLLKRAWWGPTIECDCPEETLTFKPGEPIYIPAKESDTAGIYAEAIKYFKEVQEGQIAKGRAKYPEDLNPDSWTAEQLIDHAMQEAVDQVHYLTALRKKLKPLS